jgi:hypothetical protein
MIGIERYCRTRCRTGLGRPMAPWSHYPLPGPNEAETALQPGNCVGRLEDDTAFMERLADPKWAGSGDASWAPNDTKHLFAGAADHDPVPMNGWFDELKFGRDRVHHKVRMPRRPSDIVRNCRLSGSAAFRTIEKTTPAWVGIPAVWASEPPWRCPNFTHSAYVCAWRPRLISRSTGKAPSNHGESCRVFGTWPGRRSRRSR